MLVSLRAAYPEARIDWLVQEGFEAAVSAHPALSSVVTFPRRRLAAWYTPQGVRATLGFLRGLRAAHYDLVIDAQGLLRSGVFARATGAPVRVGLRDAAEFGWLGYTHRVRSASVHTVERMLDLLEPLGVERRRDLKLYAPAGAWASACARVPALKHAHTRGYAVLAPTSRWVGKRWPIERFVALAARLLEGGRFGSVVVVGAPGEERQCAALGELSARDARVVMGVGAWSVGELMAVIERASVVVANDSAALHMAVGFDVRAVGLYGPTDVAKVGPYGPSADVVQRVERGERLNHKDAALGRRLMERISVEDVLSRLT